MKTLKILSFLLIGTIGVQTAFADDSMIKVGVRTGLNLSNISYNFSGSEESERSGGGQSRKESYERTSDQSYTFGNLMGLLIGAVVDIKIADFLYIQPGFMLSSKGTDTDDSYNDTEIYSGTIDVYKRKSNFRINPYYLDVPVMLSLKGTLAENLALRAQAGPYLGLGLFGKGVSSSERYDNGVPDARNGEKTKVKNVFSPTEEEKQNFEMIGGGLSRFNFGIGLGAGIEFSNFYVGMSYNYGLTSLMKKYEYTDIDDYGAGQVYVEKGSREMNVYERTLSITFGYNI